MLGVGGQSSFHGRRHDEMIGEPFEFEIRPGAPGMVEVWTCIHRGPSFEGCQEFITREFVGVEWAAHDLGTFLCARPEQ